MERTPKHSRNSRGRRRSARRRQQPKRALQVAESEALAAYGEGVRERLLDEHPSWDPERLDKAVQKALVEHAERRDKRLAGALREVGQTSWCPPRADIDNLIEAHAMRQLPECRVLESHLKGSGYGPATDFSLSRALFLAIAFDKCMPEFRAAYQSFRGNLSRHWAYLGTTDQAAVQENWRTEKQARVGAKLLLARNGVDLALDLNMSLINGFARDHEDVFKYLVVDATAIEGPFRQDPVKTKQEDLELAQGTSARFGLHMHGEEVAKAWRGWKLIVIGSLKLGLPLVWRLVPANKREFPYVEDLLEELFARIEPELMPEELLYLTGDKEYSQKHKFLLSLQENYGVIPVFPMRAGISAALPHADTDGVPSCAKHGLMSLKGPEGFEPPDMMAVRFGAYPDEEITVSPRLRWFCPGCKRGGLSLTETTRPTKPHGDARLHTYLPHAGDHSRALLRQALYARRNSIESLNSQFKLRGLGGRGHAKAKWAKSDAENGWLCGAGLLAITMRREVHRNGGYERSLEEARTLGLAA